MGDGGQGPRGDDHPRRPAVHPDQCARRSARADARRHRHRVPRRDRQLHAGQRAIFPRLRGRLHQRGDHSYRGFPGHRGPGRAVLRLRSGERTYDYHSWQYEGVEVKPRLGIATRSTRRRSAADGKACGSPGEASRTAQAASGSAASRARPDAAASALRLPGAQAALSPRYTPEMVDRDLRRAGRHFLQVASRSAENSGRERTTRVRLLGRLDSAHRRRAVHPHRGDTAAVAGQHRPARRRHHGSARARVHPGQHRHPDAVQPAAGLHPDAARAARTRTSTPTSTTSRRQGLLGRHARRTRSACSRRGGATPRRRTTTTASTTCPGITGDHSHLRDRDGQLDGASRATS